MKWLKVWAASLKRGTYALQLAARDVLVPSFSKFLIAIIVAYTLSPIDLTYIGFICWDWSID